MTARSAWACVQSLLFVMERASVGVCACVCVFASGGRMGMGSMFLFLYQVRYNLNMCVRSGGLLALDISLRIMAIDFSG